MGTDADSAGAGVTSLALAPRLCAPPPEQFTSDPAAPTTAGARRFGSEWPVSSPLAKTAIGAAVFALGIAAGVGLAAWMMPPH